MKHLLLMSTLMVVLAGMSRCKQHGPPLPVSQTGAAVPAPACDAPMDSVKQLLPNVDPAMLTVDYWVDALERADTPLLEPAAIAKLNVDNARRPSAFQDVTRASLANPEFVERQIDERHKWLAAKLADNKYTEQRPGAFLASKRDVIDRARPVDELRVLIEPASLRCVPMHEQFRAVTPPGSIDAQGTSASFDRNQCSGVHAAELVRVLRAGAGGAWYYVHTGHSVGWLHRPVWTPSLSRPAAVAFRDKTPRLVVTAPRLTLADGLVLTMGASLPVQDVAEGVAEVDLPTTDGVTSYRLKPPTGTSLGYLPFTRRNIYERALAYLDHPYGWGETAGGQDCSRLLLDVAATSGLRLGRHSAEQAKAGVQSVSLIGMNSTQRRAALRQALNSGVVFAYMPGHIMLMLGERQGRFYAVSAIAEVNEVCASESSLAERKLPIGKVVVSDLSLGQGTSKTSFLERLTKLAVFAER